MIGLTSRQYELVAYFASLPRPPTYAEAATRFGLRTKTTVLWHFRRIAAKGWLELTPGARGWRLTAAARRQLGPAHDAKTFHANERGPFVTEAVEGQTRFAAAELRDELATGQKLDATTLLQRSA